MNKIYLIAPVLMLAGCNQQDDRICEVPKNDFEADSCLHRNAYLMGDAEGSIKDIATAVVARCNLEINKDYMSKVEIRDVTDEAIQAHYADALDTAKRRIIESIAGKCDKPE